MCGLRHHDNGEQRARGIEVTQHKISDHKLVKLELTPAKGHPNRLVGRLKPQPKYPKTGEHAEAGVV